MFTGIVEATGSIVRAEPRGGDVRLVVDAGTLGLDDVAIGDSIAVSGVCLTAVAIDGNAFVSRRLERNAVAHVARRARRRRARQSRKSAALWPIASAGI